MFGSLLPPGVSWLVPKSLRAKRWIARTGGALVLAGVGGFVWHLALPPTPFPEAKYITIPTGSTLAEAVELLERAHIIRSGQLVEWLVILGGKEKGVQAGTYYFDTPLSAREAARRLIGSNYGIPEVVITIPEGFTSYQIAEVVSTKLPHIDRIAFTEAAREKEGYLFPDTYYVSTNATIEDILKRMEVTFYKRIEPLAPDIEESGYSLSDIVIMASLLEREARHFDERRMIAGILWERLRRDMLLQVDAVFGYINSTTTYSPRFSDLEIDSPYNTYKYKGLPAGPIANPGLLSIQAALTPIKSDYLFYLTGRDGVTYYSVTYEEHLAYKAMYLD